MPSPLDLTTIRFSRLIAIRPSGTTRNKHRVWECKCDCGASVYATVQNLRMGKVKSCGCLRRDLNANPPARSHGYTGTPTYHCWQNMIARCDRPTHSSYPRYGGQGIKVCERWHKFENFLEDIGERPEGLEIDRIDTNGNYAPENCKWSTIHDKATRSKSRRWLTANGETKTFTQWAEHLGINRVTLWERLKKWPLEKALTTPKPTKEKQPKKRYGSNWYLARRAAMKRAGGKCQRCKKEKAVHVHHRMPVRYFKKPEDANFPENLMAVCKTCHRIEEKETAARFPLLDLIAFDRESWYQHDKFKPRLITWRGQTRTLTEWGKLTGKRFPAQYLFNRLKKYSFEKAMEPFNTIILPE